MGRTRRLRSRAAGNHGVEARVSPRSVRKRAAGESAATSTVAPEGAADGTNVALGVQWTIDPAVQAQIEETLSCLTLKRRRFLRNFLASGHVSDAVRHAGYNVTTAKSACEVGRQILRDPHVQYAYQALLEARGISAQKLDAIHALHLSRHSSPDGGDRD